MGPALSHPLAALLWAGALVGCAPPDARKAGPRAIHPEEYDHAVTTDFAPEALPENATTFPSGVQAGAMTEGSALLWVFREGPGALRLRVWRPSKMEGRVELVSDWPVVPDAAGYLKVTAEPLAPATWYSYAFFLEGAAGGLASRSAIGRFRTAYPEDWDEPLTIGATSCTKFENMPYAAMRLLAKEPLDLFVHLGDMSYNDAARDLASYRKLWKRTLADPGYRELLTSVGMVMTWDDHEVKNDYDPEALARTDPALLSDAKQAFFENVPVERGPNDRLWRSYRWGKTAEFFVVDSRSERKPSTRSTPQAEYLSWAQLSWLKEALKTSPAHFKVILNSVPITEFPLPLWGATHDRWQGYAAQRSDLLGFLEAEGLDNVWFLTGDFHMGMVVRVGKEGFAHGLWEVAAGPGASGFNPLFAAAQSSPENWETVFPRNQFEHAAGNHAATTLTFDPQTDQVRVRFVHAYTEEVQFDRELSRERRKAFP